MNPVWSIVLGAVIAAVTGLLSPTVARLWLKADQKAERVRAHEEAVRTAVEEFLSSMWEADVELSITAMQIDPDVVVEDDDARKRLLVSQRQQRAEAHLALLLPKKVSAIHDLALAYTQALFEREGRGQANETGLMPIRQEAITRFSRWLSKDETAEEAKANFDAWLAVNWGKPKAIGEGGLGAPAV